MKSKEAYNKYKRQSIMTASPQELTLMLYNGCIKFIKQGIYYIDEKPDYEKSCKAMQRAQAIISELRVTLNTDIKISKDMDKMYEYANYNILQANLKKDSKFLKHSLEIIEEFKDAWVQIMNSGGSIKKKVSSY